MQLVYKKDCFSRVWLWINGKKGYLIPLWSEEEAKEDYLRTVKGEAR